MKIAGGFVEEYLGVFIQHMIDAAPNSAAGDNCRRAAELMIEAAIAEERARCAALCRRFGEATGLRDAANAAYGLAVAIEGPKLGGGAAPPALKERQFEPTSDELPPETEGRDREQPA